jgi:Ca2+-binding EF-hand superfamily protein
MSVAELSLTGTAESEYEPVSRPCKMRTITYSSFIYVGNFLFIYFFADTQEENYRAYKLFSMMDVDSGGSISLRELYRVLMGDATRYVSCDFEHPDSGIVWGLDEENCVAIMSIEEGSLALNFPFLIQRMRLNAINGEVIPQHNPKALDMVYEMLLKLHEDPVTLQFVEAIIVINKFSCVLDVEVDNRAHSIFLPVGAVYNLEVFKKKLAENMGKVHPALKFIKINFIERKRQIFFKCNRFEFRLLFLSGPNSRRSCRYALGFNAEDTPLANYHIGQPMLIDLNLGLDRQKTEILMEELFSKFDKDGSGEFEFEEFRDFYIRYLDTEASLDYLRKYAQHRFRDIELERYVRKERLEKENRARRRAMMKIKYMNLYIEQKEKFKNDSFVDKFGNRRRIYRHRTTSQMSSPPSSPNTQQKKSTKKHSSGHGSSSSAIDNDLQQKQIEDEEDDDDLQMGGNSRDEVEEVFAYAAAANILAARAAAAAGAGGGEEGGGDAVGSTDGARTAPGSADSKGGGRSTPLSPVADAGAGARNGTPSSGGTPLRGILTTANIAAKLKPLQQQQQQQQQQHKQRWFKREDSFKSQHSEEHSVESKPSAITEPTYDGGCDGTDEEEGRKVRSGKKRSSRALRQKSGGVAGAEGADGEGSAVGKADGSEMDSQEPASKKKYVSIRGKAADRNSAEALQFRREAALKRKAEKEQRALQRKSKILKAIYEANKALNIAEKHDAKKFNESNQSQYMIEAHHAIKKAVLQMFTMRNTDFEHIKEIKMDISNTVLNPALKIEPAILGSTMNLSDIGFEEMDSKKLHPAAINYFFLRESKRKMADFNPKIRHPAFFTADYERTASRHSKMSLSVCRVITAERAEGVEYRASRGLQRSYAYPDYELIPPKDEGKPKKVRFMLDYKDPVTDSTPVARITVLAITVSGMPSIHLLEENSPFVSFVCDQWRFTTEVNCLAGK